jgi:hypothetical protein
MALKSSKNMGSGSKVFSKQGEKKPAAYWTTSQDFCFFFSLDKKHLWHTVLLKGT